MERTALLDLKKWWARPQRKPLVIRGARQVGKSFLVKNFAEKMQINCLEINFERNPNHRKIFESQSISQIRASLELHFGIRFSPEKKVLLFLDEIQDAPEVFALLRYFHEDWPTLPVVAAGSLLEFALAEMDYSVPVGRIDYLFMKPMSFEEFLQAFGKPQICEFLAGFDIAKPEISSWLHEQICELLRHYLILGGMPEVLATYIQTQSFLEAKRVQISLVQTFEDDFNKYRKRIPIERLRHVFQAIPREVGKKIVYSRINPDERSAALAQVFQAFQYAGIYSPILHSNANGVPLGAEINPKVFKPLFLDVGLMGALLGVQLSSLKKESEMMFVHEGSLAEQWIGQQLLAFQPSYQRPELYYWVREKAGSMAEIDYVTTLGDKVIPIEVKAGKGGKLKSLELFMREKKSQIGIRFSLDQPAITENPNLIHLPLYLVGQWSRIANSQI